MKKNEKMKKNEEWTAWIVYTLATALATHLF